VEILVPTAWRARPIPSAHAHRHGLTASVDLGEWDARRIRAAGVEAYWVDATIVGVPTDYYYLVARGPALDRFAGRPHCRATQQHVYLDDHPRSSADAGGGFMAVASGRCRNDRHTKTATRWTSFVAAPGFGPVRELGIPQSGMYYAVVVVEEGPTAGADMERLLSSVTFGGTPVNTFLEAAETGRRR
jgi:hypothetical protein